MRGKVERKVVEAVLSRQSRVGFVGEHGIECEFDVGEQVRPAIRREGDMTGG